MKEIKDFISYLESNNEKYKVNYQNKMNPYTYSNQTIDFIDYWNESDYMVSNYLDYFEEYKNYKNIDISNQDYTFVTNVITYIIRYERFSNGLIVNNLDNLKLLLKRLVILLENKN